MTEIKFERGNIVAVDVNDGLVGVVTEVDHENAATGGVMNYKVTAFRDGQVFSRGMWYTNEDLTLIDSGN